MASPTETPKVRQIEVPEVNVEDLKQNGALALASAKELVIDSESMYELAAAELTTVKSTLNTLENMRTAVSQPLHAAMTANNNNFKAIKKPWEDAETAIKTGMIAYQDKVEADRQEAQRKAEEEARQQREEAERKEADARAEADKAIEVAAAAETPEAQAEALQRAETFEQAANDMAMEAVIAAPAVVTISRPVASGTQLRGTWKADVTDKLALIKHIAAKADENPDLLMLIEVDASALNKRAKALEKNLNLPGVAPRFERSIAARAA